MYAEATGWLQDLVRMDTSNPPGNCLPAVEYLEALAKREGLSTRRYEPDLKAGKVNLLVSMKGRGKGKPLLMLCHLDVVPADPARWKFPAFDPVIREGEIWGRGTLDMKGQGVVELMALIQMKRLGFNPARDVRILFNCDEEIGGTLGAKWMTTHHWKDLDPAYVLDEGSSGSNGIYTADGRIVFGVAVEEKKVLWMKLVAEGESGHGSMPGQTNAVQALANVCAKIPGLQPPPRDTAIVTRMKQVLGTLADNDVTRALTRTTITLTTLKAGVGDPPKVNVIPGRAEATIDCRLLPEDSAAEMKARIEALIAGTGVKLEIVMDPTDVPPAPFDTPLMKAIEGVVDAEAKGALTVPVLLAGGTDARFFRAKGVPAYGFEPMIRTPEEEELIHGDNERIRLEEFHRGLRMYHRLLTAFLK